jgi:hypothetical protein
MMPGAYRDHTFPGNPSFAYYLLVSTRALRVGRSVTAKPGRLIDEPTPFNKETLAPACDLPSKLICLANHAGVASSTARNDMGRKMK